MIHHHIDGVLQFEELAFDIDGDFLGQIAIRHCRRHRGNVAHLRGQVAGHQVNVFGKILPCAGDTFDGCLPAKFSFGSHFASYARHL